MGDEFEIEWRNRKGSVYSRARSPARRFGFAVIQLALNVSTSQGNQELEVMPTGLESCKSTRRIYPLLGSLSSEIPAVFPALCRNHIIGVFPARREQVTVDEVEREMHGRICSSSVISWYSRSVPPIMKQRMRNVERPCYRLEKTPK